MINDTFHTAHCSYIQVSKTTAHKAYEQGRPVQVGFLDMRGKSNSDLMLVELADKTLKDIKALEDYYERYCTTFGRLKYFVPVREDLDVYARNWESRACGRPYHYNDTRMGYKQWLEQNGGKRTKYYIYAGYYEMWISDIELGKPLTYQGFSYSLEKAIERCEKEDVTICYSNSLKDEVKGYFSWCDEEDFENNFAFPFFDEQEYKAA